jgi:hypothetical protein
MLGGFASNRRQNSLPIEERIFSLLKGYEIKHVRLWERGSVVEKIKSEEVSDRHFYMADGVGGGGGWGSLCYKIPRYWRLVLVVGEV